jgi:hypothetical protein
MGLRVNEKRVSTVIVCLFLLRYHTEI